MRKLQASYSQTFVFDELTYVGRQVAATSGLLYFLFGGK